MPAKSPLHHAPSFAQHRFVASMAVWFLGAIAWGIFGGLFRHGFAGLPPAGGVLIFLGAQLPLQHPVISWINRWPTPGSVGFFGIVALVLGFHAIVQSGVFTANDLLRPSPWKPSDTYHDLLDWLPMEAALLVSWYVGWWLVFRAGWLRASTALVAAGIQHVFMRSVVAVHFPALGWLWMAPVQFFLGWSLLFLPCALAAHKFPTPDGGDSILTRCLSWVGPPIAALAFLLLFESVWPMIKPLA